MHRNTCWIGSYRWLTAKTGGILTVADDLLKNDGKKFIEMMEQLAERRMQREEEAQYASHPNLYSKSHSAHNHNASPEGDDYDDEEDEEGYEDDDDYDEEDDEDDVSISSKSRPFLANGLSARHYDGGTAYGRGKANVSDIRGAHV